jgi:hypothetical protein
MKSSFRQEAGAVTGGDYPLVLRGEKIEWDTVIFYEVEHTRTIRIEDWKCFAHLREEPFELDEKKMDPRARFTLFDRPRHQGIQRALAARLDPFSSGTPIHSATCGMPSARKQAR